MNNNHNNDNDNTNNDNSNNNNNNNNDNNDDTSKLGYDGLNGTSKIGQSYAKSVVNI